MSDTDDHSGDMDGASLDRVPGAEQPQPGNWVALAIIVFVLGFCGVVVQQSMAGSLPEPWRFFKDLVEQVLGVRLS